VIFLHNAIIIIVAVHALEVSLSLSLSLSLFFSFLLFLSPHLGPSPRILLRKNLALPLSPPSRPAGFPNAVSLSGDTSARFFSHERIPGFFASLPGIANRITAIEFDPLSIYDPWPRFLSFSLYFRSASVLYLVVARNSRSRIRAT